MAEGQEKTEKPTQRRLSEARRKGQVAKSTDINTAVVLLSGVFILKWQLVSMGNRLGDLTRELFGHFSHDEYTTSTVYHLVLVMMWQFAQIVGPTLLFLMVAGLVANYAQVGVLFTVEPLKPSFAKINPLTGLGRLFSARSMVAGNVWNAGCVLGPPVGDWRRLDLATVTYRLAINGRDIGTGKGADVMGNPLNALSWLADKLAH